MRFAEDEQDEYEGIEGDCLIRKAQHKKVVIPLLYDPIIISPTYRALKGLEYVNHGQPPNLT